MRPRTSHERDAIRSDRRWMAVWAGGFLASMLLLVGIWAVYRVTGPHHGVRTFIRQIKHEARWLIPFLKRRPAKWYSDHDAAPRESGHATHRA